MDDLWRRIGLSVCPAWQHSTERGDLTDHYARKSAEKGIYLCPVIEQNSGIWARVGMARRGRVLTDLSSSVKPVCVGQDQGKQPRYLMQRRQPYTVSIVGRRRDSQGDETCSRWLLYGGRRHRPGVDGAPENRRCLS
jgi:hypothetical protein